MTKRWLSILWVLPLLVKILLIRKLMLAYVQFGSHHPKPYQPDVFQVDGSDLVPMEPGWEVCNPLPNASGSWRSYEIWQSTTKLDRWKLQWPCDGLPEQMSLPRTDCAKISELFFSGAKSSLTGFISLVSRLWWYSYFALASILSLRIVPGLINSIELNWFFIMPAWLPVCFTLLCYAVF